MEAYIIHVASHLNVPPSRIGLFVRQQLLTRVGCSFTSNVETDVSHGSYVALHPAHVHICTLRSLLCIQKRFISVTNYCYYY